MTMPLDKLIEADVSVLLMRALYQKVLVAFGEDGMGKYGKNDRPKSFYVADLDINIDADETTLDTPTGTVEILLAGFDVKDCGHVVTDKNLEISIRNALIAECINPDCLTWAPIDQQSDDAVTMIIDVPMLLEW